MILSAPRVVLPVFAGMETLALALTAFAWISSTVTATELARFAGLLVVAVLQAELSRTVERIRCACAKAPHINLATVWTFAGVLLLPAALAASLAIAVYLHLWIRVWRTLPGRPTYRIAYGGAAIVLACFAGSAVIGPGGLEAAVRAGVGGSLVIVETALVFTLVNVLLVALAVYLHAGRLSIRRLVGGREGNALEGATLVLGACTALGVTYVPVLVPFLLFPLLTLHRGVLVRQLEIEARIDVKTGVLNAGAWHDQTERALTSAARDRTGFGLLMLDLDHFKSVNDVYGHLAGDVVLKAVATAITGEVREYDAVGRFGGEEFVVLLLGVDECEVLAIAERIRQAIARLEVDVVARDGITAVCGLSASIGVALYPDAGTVLERLLHAADTALYQAKNTGRNKVVSIAAVS
jgi:diguanylate cyclase (GGDEF)-like protein